ncbi:hypothetical protein STRDD11_01004 [Streptococcus sp. DD11]|nr:hypothetical protein STRDD11_01004 [Streptococcus sp. DD11]
MGQTPMMAADEALVREGGLYRPMQASLDSATTGNSFPQIGRKPGTAFSLSAAFTRLSGLMKAGNGLPFPYLPNLSALLSNS